jgi:hypothetical protein
LIIEVTLRHAKLVTALREIGVGISLVVSLAIPKL